MIIGICGKIASGKSEVLKIFEKKGFFCIDADQIVHELYRSGGPGANQIVETFGKKYLKENAEVDRTKLRELVFNYPEKLHILNKVIHPLVYSEIQSLLLPREKDVAIESVYFDEDFLENFVNKLIWVERPNDRIIKTLVSERNFSSDCAVNALSLVKKPRKVDYVIENDDSVEELEDQVCSCLEAFS